MMTTPQRNLFVCLIAVAIILPITLIGCGDSEGVTTLNACLSDFSNLVEDYKSQVGTNKLKQAEYDAKIAAVVAKWTDLRNEFGSDITPHHMDKMVKQFDGLMLALTNFKKTLGS